MHRRRRRPMLLLQPLMLARGETALQALPTVPRPRPGPVRSLRVPPVGAKERNRSSEKTRSDVPFFPFSQPLRPSLPLPHQKKQNRLRRVRTFRPRPSLAALQAEGPQEEDADPRAGNCGAKARLQPAAASAASAAIPPGERRWWRRRPRPRPRVHQGARSTASVIGPPLRALTSRRASPRTRAKASAGRCRSRGRSSSGGQSVSRRPESSRAESHSGCAWMLPVPSSSPCEGGGVYMGCKCVCA